VVQAVTASEGADTRAAGLRLNGFEVPYPFQF
jgi:hypothetical protein